MNNNARPVPPNAPWHGQWDPNKKTPNVTDEIWESLSDDEKHLMTTQKNRTLQTYRNRKKQDELTIHLLSIFEYYKSLPRANFSVAIKKALDAKFVEKEDEETIIENYEQELSVAKLAKSDFLISTRQLRGET